MTVESIWYRGYIWGRHICPARWDSSLGEVYGSKWCWVYKVQRFMKLTFMSCMRDERIAANDDEKRSNGRYLRSIWEVYENQADIYVQRGEAYNSKWKHGEFHFFLICHEFLLELLLLAQLQFTFHSPLQSNEMQVASYQRNTTNTYLTAIFLKFNQSLFREINWFQFQ